ncbi:MAG: carbohydrate-binding domain-containing protein, partial [Oscillospiraceae bacterium]|nr:carbohydrate-binding domain-containing protein [Oscillospiraceae bacterium]
RISGAALLLSAAMVLSACGSSVGTAAASPIEQVSVQTAPALPDATPVDVDTTESAFSNRDLSGTYDASTAVRISLNGASASCGSDAVTVSGSVVTIAAAGTYVLSGSLDNGTIIIDAGKEDKVQIVLDNASVHSDTFAALYVRQADKVFVTLADGSVNELSNGGTFEAIDDNSVDGAVFSKDDLTLNGSGKLKIASPAKHGVVCKDDLVIAGGVYEITAASHALSGKDSVSVAGGSFALAAGKDGIHSENGDDAEKGNIYIADGTFNIAASSDGVSASGLLQVDGGTLNINASEGLEGTYVRINDGAVKIYASDNGINAARKSSAHSPTIEINGGDITVEVGPGDTDGIDSNGALIITGGTIDVTGNSAFDCDGAVTFTGGTVIINGQQVDSIPTQMFGRGGGRNMGGTFGARGGRTEGATPPDGNAENGVRRGRTFDGSAEGVTPPDGNAENGVRRGRTFDGSAEGATPPDGSAENGVRQWGGRGGKGRKTDGNGAATGDNGRVGKGQVPDAVTAPTRNITPI